MGHCLCATCLEDDDKCFLKLRQKALKTLLAWLEEPAQRNINTVELRNKIMELQEEILR